MKIEVNEFTTIRKFKFINDRIHEFFKHGSKQPYKEFKGKINDKKVKGFICLNDDSVYQLEYLT